MAWRVAKSLDVLLRQINGLSSNRDRGWDGSIGDAEHASRSSDHNPWVKDNGTGIVTARDFTHDPDHGIDSQTLADSLLASRDGRIKYVISNGRIASGSDGPLPWTWRPYTGSNRHDHHFHISVKASKNFYDDDREWALNLEMPEEKVSAPPVKSLPTLRKGSQGQDVKKLQLLLNNKGANLLADGDFGTVTRNAVITFQKAHNLVADGVVGGYTWKALA